MASDGPVHVLDTLLGLRVDFRGDTLLGAHVFGLKVAELFLALGAVLLNLVLSLLFSLLQPPGFA